MSTDMEFFSREKTDIVTYAEQSYVSLDIRKKKNENGLKVMEGASHSRRCAPGSAPTRYKEMEVLKNKKRME